MYPVYQEPQNKFVNIAEDTIRRFTISISDLSDVGYIEEVVAELERLNPSERDYLTININCPGGSLELTLYFINTILVMFGDRITTIISSFAYSAASLLFMVGTERIIKSGDIFNDVTFNKKRFDKILDKFFKDTLTSEERYKIEHGSDLYFDSETMQDRGMSTKLIKVTFKENEDGE